MKQNATITDVVEYRDGDGPIQIIPQGPVEIQITSLDVTLTWMDGDMPGATAIPLPEFRRFVANGAILLAPSE